MYDIFYLTDPGIPSIYVDSQYWHCLTDSPGFAPFGYLKFSELPANCKNLDGTAKHYFSGRKEILQDYDGGFDE